MKYTMKLTNRHQFPEGTDGAIFADGLINKRYTETGDESWSKNAECYKRALVHYHSE